MENDNLPPGVTVGDLPGNRSEDMAWEAFMDLTCEDTDKRCLRASDAVLVWRLGLAAWDALKAHAANVPRDAEMAREDRDRAELAAEDAIGAMLDDPRPTRTYRGLKVGARVGAARTIDGASDKGIGIVREIIRCDEVCEPVALVEWIDGPRLGRREDVRLALLYEVQR